MIKHHQNTLAPGAKIDSFAGQTTSVRKHLLLEGEIWHYRFRVAGVRIQRTTRERDLGRAEKIAQKAYEEACLRASGWKMIPTLSTLIAEWLKVHGPAVSASHVRGVESFRRQNLYELGELPISELTTERVELARNKHLETCSPATANHWLRILSLLVNWAVRRDILPRLPWKVAMLRVQQRPRPVLPVSLAREWFAELDKATENAPGIATAVRMMFGLGLRESEAAGARWEWIDWERQTYTPGVTKGGESVAIPMPRWLILELEPTKKPAGWLSVGRYGRRLRAGFARRPMAAANTACGISGITPHRLRGTFATMLSEHGTPVQTIQHVMRHKDVTTTMTYLAPALSSAITAQERIGQLIGFAGGTGTRIQSPCSL